MEQMLCQKMCPPLQVRRFLQDYRTALKPLMSTNDNTIDLQAMLDIQNESEFLKLQQNCALEQLEQENDEPVSPYIPGVTEQTRKRYVIDDIPSTTLNFVKKIKEFKDSNAHNPFKRTTESYKLLLPQDTPIAKEPLKPYEDVILTIRFYRPPRVVHSGNKVEAPVFAEEFECLGSNLLTDLRDRISCICNKKRFFDLSEQPHAENPEKTTDPGFFFITDTFYNDKRNPENADYSSTIRNWAKRAPGLENLQFTTAIMEETQFLDLNLCIGFPNLYMHHGNCEHIFIFSQIEVFSKSTMCQYREQYPRLRSMNAVHNRLCHMCNRRHFNYIVQDSNRQLHNPTYLCVNCFFGYHYIDGKKVGNFKAYRINDYTEDDEDHNTSEKDVNDCEESVNSTQMSDENELIAMKDESSKQQ